MTTRLTVAFLAVTALCVPRIRAQDAAPPPPPSSQPAPAPATGSEDALALAQKVREFAGGEAGWAQVQTLLFTFDYIDRIYWDRRVGKVRAETLRDRQEGDNWYPWKSAVYDIRAGEDVFKGGEGETPGLQAFQSAQGKWINHSFWLLAPLKVLDPGTVLAIDPQQEDDDEGIVRLRLSFQEVGITPNNEYVLHVDEATGRIDRWEFYRVRGADPLVWTFEKWTEVGPLRLAFNHNPVGPGRPIHLVDVHINVAPPEGVWSDEGRVLKGMDKSAKVTVSAASATAQPASRPTSRPSGDKHSTGAQIKKGAAK